MQISATLSRSTFGYLRDPLFLISVAAYTVNRLVLKPLVPAGFLHHHLNDLLCLPFWVPVMLWLLRRLGLRRHDGPPGWDEILVPLLLWSVIFENWLPRTEAFRPFATSDPLDVLAYVAGAVAGSVFWTCWYRSPAQAAERRLREGSRR